MSFKDYLNEQEELVVVQAEDERNTKLADFIKTMDDLNDEKFHDFAVNELGMGESEAETLVYQMLKKFLVAHDEDGDGIPDELGGEEDLEGEGSVDDEIDAEIEDEENSYV